MQAYSQSKAMLAITKASLKAIFRSPSAVVFSFLFPLIFILVFGFIGDGGGAPVYKVVITPGSDTSNAFYDVLTNYKFIRIVQYADSQQLTKAFNQGKIVGQLGIHKRGGDSSGYRLSFKTTNAADDRSFQFVSAIENLTNKINDSKYPGRDSYVALDYNRDRDMTVVAEYKTIDFILPGQIGFSLLSAGVFGVAFMFFNLRSTLVLKRFFATPINRTNIVLGEALSRVIFQLITAVVILLIGHFIFDFSLRHGALTFFELLVLSFVGLVVFMGFGFIVSGLAKNESTIPPFANLVTLPQFLLAGTFFSIDAFPKWLQPLCRILPLTHLNDAMRKVSFEGAHLYDCGKQLGILALWGIVVYFVAVKVFRWE
jgi:ABC-2 type transport system permease protein